MDLGSIFLAELVGTAVLILLGCGVVANVVLKGTKGNGGGWLLINFGWGFAVFIGVLSAAASGGHLNPAVTLGLAANNLVNGEPIDGGEIGLRILAQLIGAILGAVVTWLAYKLHFDDEPDPASKLAVFATGPAKRSLGWNTVTEIIATFILVLAVIAFSNFPGILGSDLGSTAPDSTSLGNLAPLAVAIVVVAIGASLGGPTGYAINPARDLGPRLAHAFLPIKGKGGSDWGYSWVPIVGPIIGGILAGLVGTAILPGVTA
ncbi:MIP/aquaporin family protein [Pseudoclavibacter helvolus]|uniref:MIP/aquaporin family protein n=1 Tax=Pseudoclavibacter helvolus TaxID=255205 RepID=UPI000838C5E1|nr:MIP/aquaporin family protein [Pseudoclavibacter helvolus]